MPVEPGNLTKVMVAATVMDAVRKGDVALETQFQVSEDAWRRGGAPARVTTMFARVDSLISVENLLRGLTIQSANDAALVLAQGISGDEKTFVKRMNAFAESIGMKDTRFVNATGYANDKQVTTLQDLTTLGRYIVNKDSGLMRLFSADEFIWNKIRQRNKNPLLREIKGMAGFGVAYTERQGFLALGVLKTGGRKVLAAVAGATSVEDRLSDMELLLTPEEKGWKIRPIYAQGQAVGKAKVFGGAQDYVELVTPEAVATLVNPHSKDRYTLEYTYLGPIKAPVKKGVMVGEVRVKQKKDIIYTAPLVTGGTVKKGSLQQRAEDSVRELVYKLVGF